MIRRRSNGQFLLITQVEHARLSGLLAGHFGNHAFAPPDPASETVAATTRHDCGWPLHDDHPTLNKAGEPTDVFETPIDVALPVWAAAGEVAADQADYTRLLISLHVLGLSAYAASKPHTPQEVFAINQFQHREVERQEQLRRRLGLRTDLPLQYGLARLGTDAREDQLRRNLELLQAADRISLALLCSDIPFDTVPGVIARPGDPPATLKLWRNGSLSVRVEPWPFDVERLNFSVSCRALPAEPFAGTEAFRRAYAAAAQRTMEVCVHA